MFQFLIGRVKIMRSLRSRYQKRLRFNSSQVESKLLFFNKFCGQKIPVSIPHRQSQNFLGIQFPLYGILGFNSSQVESKSYDLRSSRYVVHKFQFLIGRVKILFAERYATKEKKSFNSSQVESKYKGKDGEIELLIPFQFLIGRVKI